MTALLQIKHTHSMAYHPMGNTAIESSHFQIKTILQASRGRQPTSLWTVAVRGAIRTLNSLQQPLRGLTPNFLYYGRETALPLASLVSPPRPDSDPLTPQGRVIQLAQQSVKYLVQQRCGTEVLQRRRIHLGNMSHPPIPAHFPCGTVGHGVRHLGAEEPPKQVPSSALDETLAFDCSHQ